MKPAYKIIIIGTGQHHQGHNTGNPERDADHQLKALVDRLQQTGQSITAAAFIVDGKPEMIIGNAADLRTVLPPEEAAGVTLEDLKVQLDRIEAGLVKKDGGAGDGAAQPKSRGRGAKAAPVPAPKDGDGQSGQPLGAGVQKVLPDAPGDAQPPKEPPPEVIEDTTGDGASEESAEEESTQTENESQQTQSEG